MFAFYGHTYFAFYGQTYGGMWDAEAAAPRPAPKHGLAKASDFRGTANAGICAILPGGCGRGPKRWPATINSPQERPADKDLP